KFATPLFSDGMVLQRRMPDPVWGLASPGEQVTVSINDQTKTATADANGRWQVTLDRMEADGPYDLTVSARNTLVIHDVMIVEVWVASGQSNMLIDAPTKKVFDQYP